METGWPLEPGDYEVVDPSGSVAVTCLDDEFSFSDCPGVACFGRHRTENLGLERIVVNVISNPNIRFLVVCGQEIRGHLSGQSLLALWKNGVGQDRRIVGAQGALPFIQNIPASFVERFRMQVQAVDLLDTVDVDAVKERISELVASSPRPFEAEPIDFSKYLVKEQVASCRKIRLTGDQVAVSPEFGIVLDAKTGMLGSSE